MKQNNTIFANILLMIYLRLRGYLVLECYVNFALKRQVLSCCILLNYLLLIKGSNTTCTIFAFVVLLTGP